MEKSQNTGLPARRLVVVSDPQPPSRWAAFSAWRRECIASGAVAAGEVSEDSPVMVDPTDPDLIIDLTDPAVKVTRSAST